MSALPTFEVVGPADAPAVVVLGGISSSRHVCSSDADPSPGWWENIAGKGRAIDTNRFRSIGVDFLDAGARADGFPDGTVTMGDQADGVAAILDDVGIARAHAVIGTSFGGMAALAFAERYPHRLDRLIVVCGAHRTHAMTMALKVIQRRIVELGLETGRAHEGMVLARALATTTFRTEQEFDERFATHQDVERYLRKQGERFAERFSAARFLALSLSGDEPAIDPARITTHTTLVPVEGDRNVPRPVIDELAKAIAGPCTVVELKTDVGHDAFLTETERMGAILRAALEEAV